MTQPVDGHALGVDRDRHGTISADPGEVDAGQEAGVLEGDGVVALERLGEEPLDRVDGTAGEGEAHVLHGGGGVGRHPVPRPPLEVAVDDGLAVQHGAASGGGERRPEIGDQVRIGVAGAHVAEGSGGGEALLRDRGALRDPGAGAALGDDDARAGEVAIRGDGGVAVDAELLGEGTHRWQQVARRQLAAVHESAHAVGDLDGGAAADPRGVVRAHPLESKGRSPCTVPDRGLLASGRRVLACAMLVFGLGQCGAGRVDASDAVGPRRASDKDTLMNTTTETPSTPATTGTVTDTGTGTVKRGMAEMLKGGVIMDVVTAEQAKIAEDAGAVAVMALERVPADIRAQGGVSRMSDPDMIDGIIDAVSIPVMAKARIGHFVEAQVLQELGVDYIDESEVLSPADYVHHIDKHRFTVPFVCGATNLGEALRRLTEGAAMIRSKGEAGTGDVSEATKHIRTITAEIRALAAKSEDELYLAAKDLQAPYALVKEVAETGTLPVVLFTAGGVATPADAAMMMQLGADGVFVGSGIFKSGNPAERAAAIVRATTFYDDPSVIAEVSRGLGEAMVGINVADLPAPHRLAERGW